MCHIQRVCAILAYLCGERVLGAGIALCFTGLQRTFPLIAANVAVNLVYALKKSTGQSIDVLGVKPVHDDWAHAQSWLNFTLLATQRANGCAALHGLHQRSSDWFFPPDRTSTNRNGSGKHQSLHLPSRV